MGVRELAGMTWEEARDLKRGRTVAILPVGALEAHGPHLPLDTDVVIARAMAGAGGRRLEARGRPAVLLPPLAYAAAGFADGFPGTVSTPPDATALTVLGIARSLTRHGFACLALANAHLDPDHLAALALGVKRAFAEALLPVAFPDLTQRPWAERLGEEFMSGACHAGRFEGSVVLAAAPSAVREELRSELAPNPASLSEAIRDGKRTFEEAGGPRAYFGWPAEATAEEGRRTIRTLGEILCDAVEATLSRVTEPAVYSNGRAH